MFPYILVLKEFEFPFGDEEEFPFENEEFVHKSANDYSSDEESEEEDYRISNVYQQMIETNNTQNYSSLEYEAELQKRGAPFKLGLVNFYLRKFPFEDEEHLPNSEYYMSDDGEDYRYPNAHEVVKKFLKQVRESNGYDVDCHPPRLGTPFIPADPNPEDKGSRNAMMKMIRFAIEKINDEMGETYEFVQVEKVVHTWNLNYYFLTFTVKKVGSDELKTVRALLYAPLPFAKDCELEEWMFKPPDTDTDTSRVDMESEKMEVKIEESEPLIE